MPTAAPFSDALLEFKLPADAIQRGKRSLTGYCFRTGEDMFTPKKALSHQVFFFAR